MHKHGQMSEEVALGEDHVEFVDWHIVVPFDTTTANILCCLEDVHCKGEARHSPFTCCTSCVAPMCTECHSKLCKRTPELPPAALTNNTIIYSAPTELYELNATDMEVICASVCITFMSCFTLEKTIQKQSLF